MVKPRAFVPFNRPFLSGDEFVYMERAVAQAHISGTGPFTDRCEKLLGDVLGSRVLLTTSCTHALEMAGMLCDLGPGDEVIVPSFTFVSTANAFARTGATIRFADVDPATFAIDITSAADRVSSRTRVVVPVHYGGVPADVAGLRRVLGDEVSVVEDNAHGAGAEQAGRPLGLLGELSTYSFHETKNIQCGEGGALVVNRPELVSRAEIVREKGTNRSAFFRGDVDRYTWVDTGSSYVLSDLLAAFLLAQLEHADTIVDRRRRLWEGYRRALTDWVTKVGGRFQFVPDDVRHSGHVFAVVMASSGDRNDLLDHLAAHGVDATFHYVPLHTSPVGRTLDPDADCPQTEKLSRRLLRLPLFAGMTNEEQSYVVDTVQRWPS